MKSRKPADPNRGTELLTKLRELGRFARIFESPDFSFGTWEHSRQDKSGIWSLPYFTSSEEADRFIQTANGLGWVEMFDWAGWMDTPAAQDLIANPASVANATVDQLSKLLTACVRGERFSEGALNQAFVSGLLTAIAKRAQVLHDELARRG